VRIIYQIMVHSLKPVAEAGHLCLKDEDHITNLSGRPR
jgi:hypothetical protein